MGSFAPDDKDDEISREEARKQEHLEFLRDEGLDLLYAYKKIKDKHKRADVLRMAREYAKLDQH